MLENGPGNCSPATSPAIDYPPASRTPPNWYPDPAGRLQYRFWDGAAWTDQVSDNGVQSADPLQRNIADSIDQGLVVGSDPDQSRVWSLVTR